VTSSTLLRDEPDEASAMQIGKGNSEIMSVVAGKACTTAAAQTTAVANKSCPLSHPRSANGIEFPNAMLIELSRLA
jgi:hypothetical protein